MFKPLFNDFKFVLIIAFNVSVILLTLPVRCLRQSGQPQFRVSIARALFGQAAAACVAAFIYVSLDHVLSCQETFDCSESYVILLGSCYSFCLLCLALFILPTTLTKMLNTLIHTCQGLRFRGTKKAGAIFIAKISALYVFTAAEIVRKLSTEIEYLTASGIMRKLFWNYARLVVFAFDNLILTSLLILELKFYDLNQKLIQTATTTKNVVVNLLLHDHWRTVTLLQELSKQLGPLLVTTLVFKQLLIIGMIYFTLLSTLPDDGNDIYQILDLILPTLTLSSICFQTTKIISESHQFIYILQNLYIYKGISNYDKDSRVTSYPQLFNARNKSITACDFVTIRAGLILKILLVASTSIISIVQLTPPPENSTFTD